MFPSRRMRTRPATVSAAARDALRRSRLRDKSLSATSSGPARRQEDVQGLRASSVKFEPFTSLSYRSQHPPLAPSSSLF